MTTADPKSSDETQGLEPGWYPALQCYEPEEGYFPIGAAWDGQEWKPEFVSSYWPVKFDVEHNAKEFAREHDPNW